MKSVTIGKSLRSMASVLALCTVACSDFGVKLTAMIESVDPESGVAGEIVTISGSHFGSNVEGTVLFGEEPGVVTDWSNTRILVLVPVTFTSTLQVLSGSDRSNRVPFLALGEAPFIATLEPARAMVGDTVRVQGRGFSPLVGSPITLINDLPANLLWSSDSLLGITIPERAQSGQIRVWRDGLMSNSVSIVLFDAAPAPLIAHLDPDSLFPGDTLSIMGASFGESADSGTVWIGVEEALPVQWSDSLILVRIPDATEAGAKVVSIAVGGRQSNEVPVVIGNPPAPVALIWKMSPPRTLVDYRLKFFGTELGEQSFDRGVFFTASKGRVEAEITHWSKDSVVVMVPAGATSGDVVIAGILGESPGFAFELTDRVASFASDVQPLLAQYGCAGGTCHNSADRASEFAVETWQDVRSTGRFGRVPVQPFEGGLFVILLRGLGPGIPQMPLNLPPMSDFEIQIIEDWVYQGAANN